MSGSRPSDTEPALSMPVSRRRFLRGVLMGVPAAVALTGPGRALADGLEQRDIELINTHTGERLTAAFFRAGDYVRDQLNALNHLLRDFRTGDVHPMDPQLFEQLHDLAVLADREPRFEVISGYRSPQTNAMLRGRREDTGVAQKSMHLLGRAVDVRLVGYPTERLRDLALAARRGGVGYYRASNFVHIDTGRVRSWAG
jgi:uncharacterized protein YcbK (DUF882 family)